MNNLKASLNSQINFLCVVNKLNHTCTIQTQFKLTSTIVIGCAILNLIPFHDINKMHQSYMVHFNYVIQPMGC